MEAITIYVRSIKTGNPVANLVLRVISEEYDDKLGYVGTLDALAEESECDVEEIKQAFLLLEEQQIIQTTPIDGARFRINLPDYDTWKRNAALYANRRFA